MSSQLIRHDGRKHIWKFYQIHSHLLQILPQIQHEAETGRWKGVKPNNFAILRDKRQAYIVLTYRYADIFDMTFKVGFEQSGFDPDVSGEWFICGYQFDIRTLDNDIHDYYLSEEREFCKMVSTFLDMISFNTLFAYDEDNIHFTLLVNREWAFQKYCLMLDVVLPILFKYEATKPFISKDILCQKAELEAILNTKMDIVDCDYNSKYIFENGKFLFMPEEPNTILNKDLPF